ncbi:MAG: tetratricopeptide repeat protein [Myxococcota bacterium]
MKDDARWDAASEGAELLAEGKREAAIEVLDQVLLADDQNEYASFFLGNAFFEAEEYPRALKAYVRALELSPRYLGALIGCGHAARLMGKLDQALRCGQQAMTISEEDADAHYLLGATYFTRGESQLAIRHLTAFVSSNPEIEVRIEALGMLEVLRSEV